MENLESLLINGSSNPATLQPEKHSQAGQLLATGHESCVPRSVATFKKIFADED
jgi:hypothetical protein